jgi:hypothetical protein
MTTIVSAPRPTGPIGYVTIDGKRYPVDVDPVWWRYLTEQMDASRVLLDSTVPTAKLAPNAATDVVTAAVSSVVVTAESHTPDGEVWRDAVISADYTSSVGCAVIVTVTALYSVAYGAAAKVSLTGGINKSGAWSGANDSVQELVELSATDGERKGYISTSRAFTVQAGEVNTFAFMCKVLTTVGAPVFTLSNVYMRIEAIKA